MLSCPIWCKSRRSQTICPRLSCQHCSLFQSSNEKQSWKIWKVEGSRTSHCSSSRQAQGCGRHQTGVSAAASRNSPVNHAFTWGAAEIISNYFFVLMCPRYTEVCLWLWVWGQHNVVEIELEDPAFLCKWNAQVRTSWRVQPGKTDCPDRRGGASSAEKESWTQGGGLLFQFHRSSYKCPNVTLRSCSSSTSTLTSP